MKNRDLKKLDEKFSGAVSVPDGVLDAARDEMGRRGHEAPAGEETRRVSRRAGARKGLAMGGAVAVSRRAAVWCAVAVLALVIVAAGVYFAVRFSSGGVVGSDDQGGYRVSELEREEISSVEEYNETHSASYLSYAGESVCFVYRSGSRDVMLEQDFEYCGAECVLYIVMDEEDDVDVLSGFLGLYDSVSVNGFDVRCGEGEGRLLSETGVRGSRYCLSVLSDDADLILGLLGEILA